MDRKTRKAFTMLEVVISLLFFTMMALLVALVVPMAARSSRQGNDFNQASALLLHKIDQLQTVGYSQLGAGNLVSLGIVDDAGSLPAVNPTGDLSGSATFSTADRLTAYFVGAGTEPKGELSLAPYAPSAKVVSGATTYTVIQATVTVTWRDVRGQLHTQSMRTLIPKSPLQ